MPICFRCKRDLSSEKPVWLPDGENYCCACCESMATDTFEMETGERFSDWIAKHPTLTMTYQPLEINVRTMAFYFPLLCAFGGLFVLLLGCWKFGQAGFQLLYLAGGLGLMLALGALAALIFTEKIQGKAPKLVAAVLNALLLPALCIAGLWYFGKPAAYIVLGLFCAVLFGALAARGLFALLRARGFSLTLENGVFNLRHGKRAEIFNVADLNRVCVVRPGTVGATEGALGFKDGRMLSLDTCLSDLHALGVVLDLRFREDFPPSADDLARVRRDKLRKIRGLT